jgi:hypothetical protein
MTSAPVLAHQLSKPLDLAHAPVVVRFDPEPATGGTEPIPAQRAGCYFHRPEKIASRGHSVGDNQDTRRRGARRASTTTST